MTAMIDMQDARADIVKDAPNYKMIAENVSVFYDGIQAVKNVTMKFREKSVTSLIGPSGCGLSLIHI